MLLQSATCACPGCLMAARTTVPEHVMTPTQSQTRVSRLFTKLSVGHVAERPLRVARLTLPVTV